MPRGLILDGEQGFPFLSYMTELDQIQLLVLVGKTEECAWGTQGTESFCGCGFGLSLLRIV